MSKRFMAKGMAYLVLMTFTATAWANEPSHGLDRLSLGLMLGVDRTTFGGRDASTPAVKMTGKTGVALSLFSLYALHDWFSLGAGVLFAQKGARLELNGVDSGGQELSYLEFPVIMRVHPPLDGSVAPYFVASSNIALLLDSTVVSNSGNSVDYRDETRPFDLGLALGLGASLDVSPVGTIDLEVQYMWGIIRIDATEDNDDLKNRAVFLTFGYQHNLADLVARIRGEPRTRVKPAGSAEASPAKSTPTP